MPRLQDDLTPSALGYQGTISRSAKRFYRQEASVSLYPRTNFDVVTDHKDEDERSYASGSSKQPERKVVC